MNAPPHAPPFGQEADERLRDDAAGVSSRVRYPPRGGDIGPGDAHDCGTIGTLIELDHEESNGEGGHGCVRRRDPQRDEQRSNTRMRR